MNDIDGQLSDPYGNATRGMAACIMPNVASEMSAISEGEVNDGCRGFIAPFDDVDPRKR